MIRLDQVSYTYPFQDAPAVTDISMAVAPGEAVLCTGASGSGKSTLIRLINGLAPHYYRGTLSGRVAVDGRDSRELSVGELSKTVGTMFQDPEHQFFALKVEDEMAFALECRGLDRETIEERIASRASDFGIDHLRESTIFNLSQGEKQKLALAGILCLDPRVIILDEPSANLDPESTLELAGILKKLKARGITLFIVDHRLYWLRDLVDQVHVLDQGRVVARGGFEILDDPGLRGRYGLRRARIPSDVLEFIPPASGSEGDLEVFGLTHGYKGQASLFGDVSFCLPRGEVIAVTGDNGVGKTTLARLLTGLLPLQAGSVSLDGEGLAPRDLLRQGSIVLQNTDHQLHMKTVEEELLAAGRRFMGNELKKKTREILEIFGLDGLKDRHPQSLSGGQKQRLVIGAALMKSPKLLILDEPTSGLDGANMEIMAHVMSAMAAKGACVLVITHDLELVQGACSSQLSLPLP